MPTVAVNKAAVLAAIGEASINDDKSFGKLCFDFGIELDEVTSEREIFLAGGGDESAALELSEEVIYKLDIPGKPCVCVCVCVYVCVYVCVHMHFPRSNLLLLPYL
jgi:phenylalanyl-tRNA synthetase beta chain